MPLPKTPNGGLQTGFYLAVDHVAVTADTTVKLDKVPSGLKLRIDSVQYVNPTGLAQDASNYFNIKVLKGASTVVANWSTLTGAEGTLTANTFVNMVMSSTDADKVLDAADELSYFLDETGTASLPAGRIVIRGRYV